MDAAITICQLAGILVLSGSLFLLYKEKIYLNAATGEVINIDIPIVGKIKSNTPTLVLVLFGIILVLTPLWFTKMPYLTVTEHLNFGNGEPIQVRAYAVTMSSDVSSNQVMVKIPKIKDEAYQPSVVLFSSSGLRLASTDALLAHEKNGIIDLGATTINLNPVTAIAPSPQLRPLNEKRPEGF